MFRRRSDSDTSLSSVPAPMDRVTTVLGPDTIVKGRLSGSGGVRIEGSFEGEISLQGLLVIGENGKVTCENILATIVVIAGAVKGNISAEKIEIRSSGRVWGDVVTSAFATQEGAFLRGQVRMEEQVELDFVEEGDGAWVQTEEVQPVILRESEGSSAEAAVEIEEGDQGEKIDVDKVEKAGEDGGDSAATVESSEGEKAKPAPKPARKRR